jgi:hypothetical protein
MMFEFFQGSNAHLLRDLAVCLLKLIIGKGMHPIPKLIVVQIAVNVGLILEVLWVFLRVVNLGFVPHGWSDVVFVKVIVAVSDFGEEG